MKSIYLIVGLSLVLTSFGQNKKPSLLFQKAMSEKGLNHIDPALELLNQAITADPDDLLSRFQRGIILEEFKKDFKSALDEFNIIKTKNDTFSLLVRRHIADCYFRLQNYKAAHQMYQAYLNQPGVILSKNKDINIKMNNCDFAEANMQFKKNIQLVNIGGGVNTEAMEYFPSLSADETQIYFTRKKDNSLTTDEDIYVANLVDNKYQNASPVNGPINTEENEGAHTIAPGGKYLLFTACNRKNEFYNTNSCDLYISKLIQNTWGKPNNLGSPVNTSAWESQPSISADSKTLFFSSNRQGGYGGLDIWYTKMNEKGQFEEPINAGPMINTPWDEDKPFLHPDGQTIYFVSNGHAGFGGKDIYKTKLIGSIWLTPYNLGQPINSPDDENGIFVNAFGNKGFISAVRPEGKGNSDIYMFDLPADIQPTPVSFVKGKVTNLTGKPQASIGKFIDLSNQEVHSTFMTDSTTGEFMVFLPVGKDYSMNISSKGHLFYSEIYQLKNETGKAIPLHAKLSPIEKGAKIELKNVFFETNQYNIKPESTSELNDVVKFMQSNPNVSLEIGGHTDNVGKEIENKTLSENRAKSVKDFIIKAGIEATRLSAVGYGSSKPVESNKEMEGRAKNRRTEITIL